MVSILVQNYKDYRANKGVNTSINDIKRLKEILHSSTCLLWNFLSMKQGSNDPKS